ncbi:TadE/TadG family type IV pilus assembly protein [Aestuariivirga sp.]|uniref:TadE/TadG family type IV pilus assembly protein n=1 Tax=Aestuariivirga sp. TaxID=2650926 RepID=UPI00391B88F2
MIRRNLHKLHSSEDGASLLEATVVLPVFVFLMAGIADFGLAYGSVLTAQKSLRSATRYLSMLPSQAVCGWGKENAIKLAGYGNIKGEGEPLIAGWDVPKHIIVDEPKTCSSVITVIRMKATVPYSAIIWPVVGLPEQVNFQVEHEERWIGQ